MQQPETSYLGVAELEALRSIAESTKATASMIAAQSGELRVLTKKIDDVQERVIRLEEQRHGRDIERLIKAKEDLEARISTLELSQAVVAGKFQGAGTLLSIVKAYLPLLAILVAGFLYIKGLKTGKLP